MTIIYHIYLDCQMPEMDGYQSAAAIRQWERERGIFPPVNIVALSGMLTPLPLSALFFFICPHSLASPSVSPSPLPWCLYL